MHSQPLVVTCQKTIFCRIGKISSFGFGIRCLNPVCFIVRAKKYEFNCLIICLFTICTVNNKIVSLFSTDFTKQINNNKIPLHRARVEPLQIAFQWLPVCNRILDNQINFTLNSFFDRSMLFQRIEKGLLKFDFHQLSNTSS